MGLFLFSRVHLAEFNFLSLPVAAEPFLNHRFLFCSSFEAKKTDAVGLSSEVLSPQYQVIAWHILTSLSDACLSECLVLLLI